MRRPLAPLLAPAVALAAAFGDVSVAPAAIQAGPIADPTTGHHYYLLDAGTWAAKEAEAVALGGHLVTINGAAENTWVWQTFSALAPGPFWIGLTDESDEGHFEWTSGQPLTYESWWTAGGEPNNTGGNEHYVELNNGVWNDNTANRSFRAVVEVAPELESTLLVTRDLEVGQVTAGSLAYLPYFAPPVSYLRAVDVAPGPGGTLLSSFLVSISPMFVTDIYRVDPVTASATVFAAGVGGGRLATEPSGSVLTFNGELIRLDGTTGTQLAQLSVCLANSVMNAAVVVDQSGSIFVSGMNCGGIFRVDASLSAATVVYAYPPAEIFLDLAIAADGKLLLTTLFAGSTVTLRSVDPTSGTAAPIMTMSHFSPAWWWLGQLAVDGDGGVLLSREHQILKVDPSTGSWSVLPAILPPGPILGMATLPMALPACSDSIDQDGDGLVDFPADPGCADASDASETAPGLICDNGVDDDGDGRIDYAVGVGVGDPGCGGPLYVLENPQCQNGLDDDSQEGIDFDGGASLNGGVPVAGPDPQCVGRPYLNAEGTSCGLGGEVALLLPLFGRLRSRFR